EVKTPPMGWNSWNTFGNQINEKVVFETVDAMVEKGYKDAGYEYVVIDDIWSLKSRNEKGELEANPEKFPHGMKYVGDYIHSKGLKFGIYSCAGYLTCGGYPGSYGYEFTDAKTFADWGVDFLKYDFCYFPDYADGKHAYLVMSNALRTCGRDILFSACNWGVEESWNWMREIGAHMYRSTGDIFDNFVSIKKIMEEQEGHFNLSGYGSFNDLDMLVCGMDGSGYVEQEGLSDEYKGNLSCSRTEHKLHFTFWAMFSTPLIMGCDIRNVDEYYRKLMTNPLLLKINQDSDARPPILVKTNYPSDVKTYIKLLSDGNYAIGFFNLGDTDFTTRLGIDAIGFPRYSGIKLQFTDVFTGKDEGIFGDVFQREIPSHDCLVYIVKAVK
ncbi:MAG: glycoside hydrolase family 27 protein, partial [Clostridia bacterium]|nr:glycoside hydrolase family 27 protein [Clostridia bacterium]